MAAGNDICLAHFLARLLKQGVLDNYLQYFVRSRGRVLYRGLEMSQLGRLLVLTAEYYFYTGDEALILRHQDKLRGIAEHLHHRFSS